MDPTKQTTHKRLRHSREQINTLLQDFEQSRQTQVAFCRERGINVPTFCNWRKKYASHERSAAELRPVHLVGATGYDAVTIRTQGGIQVVLPAGTAAACIADLVKALELRLVC